jgi:MoxR-like ATPase
MAQPSQLLGALGANLGKVILGQPTAIRWLIASFAAGGHVLLEDMPGTGKTTLANALAKSVHANFKRVQFTADLLPSDIIGVSTFDPRDQAFHFHEGPIFSNILLADEINRASPRTQSALLEAMAEGQVTAEGVRRPLPQPFFVVATQNPVDYQGTYPLPEAQLDRFLFKVLVDYGSGEAERGIIERHHAGLQVTDLETAGLAPLVDGPTVLELRAQVAETKVDQSVADYLVAIGRATRTMPEVQYGASVRGALGLLHASKAIAAFAGRDYVTPDDVKAVAVPVLRHRIVLKPEAELDGLRADDVVQRILGSVPVPR